MKLTGQMDIGNVYSREIPGSLWCAKTKLTRVTVYVRRGIFTPLYFIISVIFSFISTQPS